MLQGGGGVFRHLLCNKTNFIENTFLKKIEAREGSIGSENSWKRGGGVSEMLRNF